METTEGQKGRWVFVPDGAPAPASSWSPPPPRRDVAGRAGLFVGGYFALGFVQWMFWNLAQVFLGEARAGWFPVGVLAVVFAAGLLVVAARTRGRPIEPLGIMGAFGATAYVAVAAGALLYAAGIEGRGLFWGVVALTLPAALAVLIWLPHPILGVNVGIAVVVAISAARVADEGAVSTLAAKTLLMGFVLLALALVVEVRTRTRAGSALHYMAVLAYAVGKIAAYAAVDPDGLALATVASIATIELFVAVVVRRRSWAYSGWLTLELAGVGMLAMLFASGSVQGRMFGFVGPVIIVGALIVQRQQDRIRQRVLAALPAQVAERFPG